MKRWCWYLCAAIVVAFDQIGKYWAEASLTPYWPKPILPFFNLTLAYNKGAAFSFLSGAGEWSRWFFVGLSLSVSVGVVYWIETCPKNDRLRLLALSFVLGGALGNLYDRLFLGRVVDFIDVYYGVYHWPIFNLADSAICIGALLLLFDMRNTTK